MGRRKRRRAIRRWRRGRPPPRPAAKEIDSKDVSALHSRPHVHEGDPQHKRLAEDSGVKQGSRSHFYLRTQKLFDLIGLRENGEEWISIRRVDVVA
ncbi:hypothetical protein EJB05_46721, partial [Eragrostis curvula]